MPVMIAMGGMALAQGIFGAFGASSQAKAQAMAAEVQQRNANFRAQWQKEAQDRNVMRQFQANLERNIQIEKAANRERALSELYLDKGFANQKSVLSKQTAQVNAQFAATMGGRGLTPASGTARAMLRQNMESLGANMAALKVNHKNAYNDIVNQQKARLSQRASTIAPDLGVFIPATGGIADNSSAALTTGLIQAGLQGVSTGINAYLEYGSSGGNTGGGYADTGADNGGYGPPSWLAGSGAQGNLGSGMVQYNTRTGQFQ